MLTEPRGQSLETWVDIDQLLTRKGRSARFVDFIAGNAVTEGEGFVGKECVLDEIEAKAFNTGIVVIQAGHRTGKTSLLLTASDRLQKDGVVVAKSYLNLQGLANKSVSRLQEIIDDDVTRRSKGDKKKSVKKYRYVVAFDEVEAYKPSLFPDLVNLVRNITGNGNIALFGVIGDLSTGGEIPGELNDRNKAELVELVGQASLMVNPLMTDDEVRDLLSTGALSVFTESAIQYLVKESGGHPFLANGLARELFSALREVKEKRLGINNLPDEVKETVRSMYCAGFDTPVETVIARGFNPLTWEYIGPPEYSPNVEVYRNMLPRESSAIFRGWLEKYLEEKG